MSFRNHDVLARSEREVQRTLTKGILLTRGHLSIDRIHVDRATSEARHISLIEEIAFAIDREGASWRGNLRFHKDRFDDGLGIVPSHRERLSATRQDQQQAAGGTPTEQSHASSRYCPSHDDRSSCLRTGELNGSSRVTVDSACQKAATAFCGGT